jgi:lipid-binding SYLF domain-containing protein
VRKPMKIATFTAVLLAGMVAAAQAAPTAGETQRIRDAAAVLNSMHGSEASIPQNIWNKAACVIVIPGLKKAAFGFGGEYGKGVMTCRRGTENEWTAPSFVRLEKGSWGFQIGAEETDLVLMVMNHTGMDKLLQDKVSLGAGASVAAGPVGRTANAATDAQMSAEILSYSRSHGLFAGIDISGGVLGPDTEANANLYGHEVNPKHILADAAVPTPSDAQPFITAVKGEYPVATTGRGR